jgi:hypothetical protein
MPGVRSPSTLNLYIPKCFALFQRTSPVVDAAPIHLGKLTNFDYTAQVEIADFYDESQGIRILIDSAIQQVGGRFRATLHEATAFNFGLYVLGNPNYTTPATPTVGHFENQEPTYGQLTVVGTNGKGPRVMRTFTNVLIAPDGDLSSITRDYGSIPLAGRHLADWSNGFGQTQWMASVNSIAPTNWTPPFIIGAQNPGDDWTFPSATEGDVLTASGGQWTAGVIGVGYAVQWYRNASNSNTGGSAITGATAPTYTVQSADVGDYLYLVVSATNSIGTTTASSVQTAIVAS